ncbi:hypothetical protein PSV08DRAFT_412143 [Bipolaris maydis]|nr:hypothetical protein PSV08DRAFT_412143 [Bipolaris maydis]KAJ6277823.1 hypothetical protein J3E71DRAFT_394513 [Bipolaris maydis]
MRRRDRTRALLAPGVTRIRPASPGLTPTLEQPESPLPPSSPALNSIASSRVTPEPMKSQNQALGKSVELQLQKLPEAGRAAFEEEIKSLDDLSLLSKIRAYDEKHKNESSFRPHAERLTKGLDLISRLMRGVAIDIQADPAISSPVIGALRVIIDIGLEFSKFFTRLTDMICEFEDYLVPLSEHSQAADIELVESAVVNVFTNILEFSWNARSVFVHTVQATHFNHARITAQRTERKEFLSWASDIDFEEVHQSTYAKKHRDTSDWLTQEPKFQEWMRSPHSSLLWCNGKPTLIKQLCQGMQDIPETLPEIMRNARSPSLLEKFSEVFVVFDALDECPEERREDILGFITEMVTMPAPHCVKIFATSRRETDITEAFVKKRHRFLWVNLQLENLCQASKAQKDEVNLSDTYVRILERIEMQSPYMRDLAIRCLAWVLYAQRPLRTCELQVALAVDLECKTRKDLRPDSPEVILEACGNLLEEAAEVIRPIHYTVQEFLTTAAHGQSQHAIRRQLLDLKSVHNILSLDCLMYIDLMSFSNPVDAEWELIQRLDSHNLAIYAYTSFDYHILNSGEPSPDVMDRLERLFQQDRNYLAALLQINLLPNGYCIFSVREWFNKINFLVTPAKIIYSTRLYKVPAIRQRWVGQSPPIYVLHLAASAGLVDAIMRLLEEGVDINEKDGVECTSMHYACQNGHLDIAQILASKGADIDAQGGYFGNALQAASFQGHTQMVKFLIDNKADVNAQAEEYGNAPQAASCEGHTTLVKMLIDSKADVNARGGAYGSALQAASYEGFEQIVRMLLNAGADINAPLIQMLLDGGANANAPAWEYYNSPLQAASLGGHEQTVQILLNAGADVNLEGGRDGSALEAARGHKQVVQMLLDAGAHPLEEDDASSSPANPDQQPSGSFPDDSTSQTS